MEAADKALIEKMLPHNMQLRRLFEEHEHLDDRIAALERRSFLTAREELERKALKLKKLRGVDRMMEILSGSRGADAAVFVD